MSAVDPDALARLEADLGGERAVTLELLDIFLKEAPLLVEALREGAAAGDRAQVFGAAHTLKSNAATFGAHALSRMCAALETRTGKELPDVRTDVGAIAAEWERVRAELAAWAQRGH